MGEIAEMMLDGTLCEACGTVMDDMMEGNEPPGHPRYCSRQCAKDRGADWPQDTLDRRRTGDAP